MPDDSLNVSDEDRVKFLWDALKRIDFYINSLNTKGALLMTFNAAVLGFVVSKWSSFIDAITPLHCSAPLAQGFLGLGVFSTIISIYLTLAVVFPFLQSASGKNSLLFFQDINSMSPLEYKSKLDNSTSADLINELIGQIVILSKGASSKFNKISWAIKVLFFVQMPSFISFAVIVMFL